MMGFYKRYYWRLGFKSRLYDWLTPESYRQSLRTCVRQMAETEGQVWLDAGCGSGLLMESLKGRFPRRYIGVDILLSGLAAAREKAGEMGIASEVLLVQGDLSQTLPLRPGSVDAAIAHFSIYTLDDALKRRRVLENLHPLIKLEGRLVVVNPSMEYDPREIIRESIETDRQNGGGAIAALKKWLVYPITLRFGLKFIQQQLRQNIWHAYSLEELCEEITDAGFKVEHTETVYGNSAHLVVARPVIKKK